MAKYKVRAARNQESKQVAGRDGDIWTDDDVAYLNANFTESALMVDVAAHLGRTVEACRQRYYSRRTVSQGQRDTRTPGQRQWDKGMISFDDMGKDWW